MRFTGVLYCFCALSVSFKGYGLQEKKIDVLVQAFMREQRVPGVSVAVIDKNRITTFNYGYADETKKIPTTDATVYTIASFSKPITATLAAVASVEGRLDLDSSFIRYFPELKNAKRLEKITSGELLGHTSSFPFKLPSLPRTYAELMQELIKFVPPVLPGRQYQYSNLGIGLAGYALQNIYGEQYEDILKEKLLKPLQMNSTFLNLPAEKERDLAVGHDGQNRVVPYDKTLDVFFAAGDLKSTIVDMARFLKAQIDPMALQDKTLSQAIDLVHKNYFCFSDGLSCEQLAWQARDMKKFKDSEGDTFFRFYDSSGTPVFHTKQVVKGNALAKKEIFVQKTCAGFGRSGYMVYLPREKRGVVLLLNKNVGDERIRLGREILDLL